MCVSADHSGDAPIKKPPERNLLTRRFPVCIDKDDRALALQPESREMQIFIGAESEFSSQGDVTVIASPYGSGDNVLGTVGVIGPTRMNYQRIIGLVDFTAQVLSKGLDDK